ncbi:hypothetical protein EI42_06073 [Thermosporothrix hazakensis]|jgi:hypothetical protein|uniref:Uncharacterized protein n=1 Tax=Thermosporothrix hazakensis TaxID=644383 RepID=A0A326U633_THEHA|nr:hypothetical protein [Thermosporothrix hazakensis]PZW19377.1 hypothetical protein EI42_06073 [Thermosporothrix hazakensis]GCE48044.1 hypothetical protein KTH_29130 [Thermosporothrix hazakensis]
MRQTVSDKPFYVLQSAHRRPTGVTLSALFSLLSAALLALLQLFFISLFFSVIAMSLSMGEPLLGRLFSRESLTLAGSVLLLFALEILCLLQSWGFWKLKRWAYWLALVNNLLGILQFILLCLAAIFHLQVPLLSQLVPHTNVQYLLLFLLFPIEFFYLLFNKNVKQAFHIPLKRS